MDNMTIYYIIGMYIAVCALVGTVGINRQIGFLLSFVISLFTTPLIGLIVTALSSKNKVEVSVENNTPIKEKESVSDELLKLNELKEKGILTEEEFQKQKVKILG